MNDDESEAIRSVTVRLKGVPHDDDGRNDERSEWADQAVLVFRRRTGTDHEDALADLLGNLRHWADRHGFDFEKEAARGAQYYKDETTPGGVG